MKKPVTVYSRKIFGVECFVSGFTEVGNLLGRSACRIIGDTDGRWSLYREYRNGWNSKGTATTSDAIRWVALGVLPDEERR
jgi:hypothetical protein